MSTVVTLRNRDITGQIGKALGEFGSAFIEARARKKDEEQKKAALKTSIDLFNRALQGKKLNEPVSDQERSQAALFAGGGPTNEAAGIMDAIPRSLERDITGSDIADPLIEAGFDEDFISGLIKDVQVGRSARANAEFEAGKLAREEKLKQDKFGLSVNKENTRIKEKKGEVSRANRELDLEAGRLDVSKGNLNVARGGLDLKQTQFDQTLTDALDQDRKKILEEDAARGAVDNVLEEAASKGSSRESVIRTITKFVKDIPTKLDLLSKLDTFFPKTTDDKDVNIKLFTPDGESITVPVSPDIAKNKAERDQFVKDNFPGFLATPVAKPTVISDKAAAVKRLVEIGTSQEILDKIKTGIIEVRGPDAAGRVTIVDKETQSLKVLGGDLLTPTTLRKMEVRILALSDAITALESADLSGVGIDKIIAAEIGGIAIQIPVLGAITRALGLSEEEIGDIQAKRGKFTQIIAPLVQSFMQDGERRSLATNSEIDLANDMLNMLKLSSTAPGAILARRDLVNLFKKIRKRTQIQRLTGSVIPPTMIEPKYIIDENGKLAVEE